MHGDIVPDIVTTAKGLTSSYIPLGVMAVSDPIAEHFRKNVFWGGLTYNAHALCLGTALAAIDVLLDEGMIENAAAMEAVQRKHMQELKDKHPSVREFRAIGLFGMVDTVYTAHNVNPPQLGPFTKYLRDNGLFTFVRWGSFMCNPPLCINEEQLGEAYAIIDKGLDLVDATL